MTKTVDVLENYIHIMASNKEIEDKNEQIVKQMKADKPNAILFSKLNDVNLEQKTSSV